jgi:integrase
LVERAEAVRPPTGCDHNVYERVRALAPTFAVDHGAGDYVIGTAQGKPVQERNLRRALDAAKNEAGLDGTEGRLSFHSLRHSYLSLIATDLEVAGTTLARVAGNTDAGFTMRVYARDARSTEALVSDVLGRARNAGVGS